MPTLKEVILWNLCYFNLEVGFLNEANNTFLLVAGSHISLQQLQQHWNSTTMLPWELLLCLQKKKIFLLLENVWSLMSEIKALLLEWSTESWCVLCAGCSSAFVLCIVTFLILLSTFSAFKGFSNFVFSIVCLLPEDTGKLCFFEEAILCSLCFYVN